MNWEKKIALPIWVGIIQFLESLKRTERQGEGKFTHSAWAERYIFSCPGHQSSLKHHGSQWAFQLRSWLTPSASPSLHPYSQDSGLRLNYSTLTFLVFQLVDARSWGFSATATVWAKSYNKSLLVYIFISYWFCFFGESLLIQIFQNRFLQICFRSPFFLLNLNKMNLNVSVKNSISGRMPFGKGFQPTLDATAWYS